MFQRRWESNTIRAEFYILISCPLPVKTRKYPPLWNSQTMGAISGTLCDFDWTFLSPLCWLVLTANLVDNLERVGLRRNILIVAWCGKTQLTVTPFPRCGSGPAEYERGESSLSASKDVFVLCLLLTADVMGLASRVPVSTSSKQWAVSCHCKPNKPCPLQRGSESGYFIAATEMKLKHLPYISQRLLALSFLRSLCWPFWSSVFLP